MIPTQTFGPYTVVSTFRLDNPAFPQYTVMRDGKIIARSLSALDRGWCEFLERHAKLNRYVEHTTQPGPYAFALTKQRSRAGKRGRAARIAARAHSKLKV